MKLPNGFGSCYKLSGRRRRPWIAVVTIGIDEEGKPIRNIIGYYPTREEGLTVLAEKHKGKDITPDIKPVTYTLKDIYEKWTELTYGNKKIYCPYVAAWKKMKLYYDKNIVSLDADNLQYIVNENKHVPSIQIYIKVLFNKLFTYAMQRDIVMKNYAQFIVLPKQKKSTIHKAIKEEDIKLLWQHINDPTILATICMIYLGTRPSEFFNIKKDNVHLEEHYLIGGMKTEAGRNRIIPIPHIIEELVTNLYANSNEYLYELNGKQETYSRFRDKFEPRMTRLKLNYKPHDCRHTCATALDNKGVAPNIIRRVLGHSGAGITEQVYTHKSIEQLVNAVYNIYDDDF